MEIGVLFQIAAVGILVAVINQVLQRGGRDEQATMVTLAGIVLVLFWIVGYVGDLFTQLREIFNL